MAKKSHPASFGARLQQLREAAGLSVTELADRAGMQRTFLHALESGRKGRQPSFQTVARLALALGVTAEKLYQS
jgi:transcriptional regulator with XRE-family HTH domain